MTEDVSNEFPLADEICYLNHAAVSPWPRRTQQVVARFAEENLRYGARYYPRWMAVEQRLRGRLKRLVNAASTAEIALLKNTSEALSVVAYGLDWQVGDNVVITDQEFPSNRIVWESLSERFGVEVRYARLQEAGQSPERAIINTCDERTRLVSVSSVQYGSGLRLDLSLIGAVCRQQKILFAVDAIQSVGALAVDVQVIDADFLMADGHKWMLGPEGLALFYCRREVQDRLRLNQFGWHMVAAIGDYENDRWQVADSARRFESGSPNMLAIHALDASIGLLLDIGMETVEREVLARQRYLAAAISADPAYRLLSPDTEGYDSGIVTFQAQGQDNQALYEKLMAEGVICAYRFAGVRLSAHFYTPYEKLDTALKLLAVL